MFGGAKDFCPNFPILDRKVLCDICLHILSYKDHEDFF